MTTPLPEPESAPLDPAPSAPPSGATPPAALATLATARLATATPLAATRPAGRRATLSLAGAYGARRKPWWNMNQHVIAIIDRLDARFPELGTRPLALLVNIFALIVAAVLGNQEGVLQAWSPVVLPLSWPPRWYWSLSRPLHGPAVGLALLGLGQWLVVVWSSRRDLRLRHAALMMAEEAEEQANVMASAERAQRKAAEERERVFRVEATEREQAFHAASQSELARMQAELYTLNKKHGLFPSAIFVQYFREGMTKVLRAATIASDAKTAAGIDAHIRTVLGVLVGLVQTYDQAMRTPGAVRYLYSASIFRFYSCERLQPARKRQLELALRFVPDNVSFMELNGVLELQQKWSWVDRSPDHIGVDQKLGPLALPLLRGVKPDAHLPGACVAWATRNYDRVESVAHFRERVRRAGLLPETRLSEIKDFFDAEEAAHIASFLAVPLTWPEDASLGPVGTVHVNCSVDGLLQLDEHLQTISPFLQTAAFVLPAMIERSDSFAGPRKSHQNPRRGRSRNG